MRSRRPGLGRALFGRIYDEHKYRIVNAEAIDGRIGIEILL